MMIHNEIKTAGKDIARILIDHGIRPTRQRQKIATELLSRPQHLSADQLLALVNQKQSLVSKATVYNTLNLFSDRGLVRQVIVDSGKVFYDSNIDPHHHIYNEDTGQLYDIEASRVNLEKTPELPTGTKQTGVDIIIRVSNNR